MLISEIFSLIFEILQFLVVCRVRVRVVCAAEVCFYACEHLCLLFVLK